MVTYKLLYGRGMGKIRFSFIFTRCEACFKMLVLVVWELHHISKDEWHKHKSLWYVQQCAWRIFLKVVRDKISLCRHCLWLNIFVRISVYCIPCNCSLWSLSWNTSHHSSTTYIYPGFSKFPERVEYAVLFSQPFLSK